MNAVGSKEPAESHLNFVANRDFIGLAIGHLAHKAAAAVVIDNRIDRRRIERISQTVDCVGGDTSGAIGERIRFHLIESAAFDTYPLGRELRRAAGGAFGADQAEFPLLRTEHRRTRRAVGVGTARWFGRQNLAPFEVVTIGYVALRFDHPTDGMDRVEGRGGGRDLQHDRVGAVADGHEQDMVAGFGGGQDRSEHQGGVRGTGLAYGQCEAVGNLGGVNLELADDFFGGALIGRIENYLGDVVEGQAGLGEDVVDDLLEERIVGLGQGETFFP